MSDFIVSYPRNAASKSTSVFVHVDTNYCKPSELMLVRPLMTMPVRGRVKPVNDPRPASVTFLQ